MIWCENMSELEDSAARPLDGDGSDRGLPGIRDGITDNPDLASNEVGSPSCSQRLDGNGIQVDGGNMACMKDKAPGRILTDQAAAMRKPLEEVMPSFCNYGAVMEVALCSHSEANNACL